MRIVVHFATLPAASDALRTAQVLEKRNAIFSAEVDKLYMLHAVVEEDTCNYSLFGQSLLLTLDFCL